MFPILRSGYEIGRVVKVMICTMILVSLTVCTDHAFIVGIVGVIGIGF